MPDLRPGLDWQPVLLVKVMREAFTGVRHALHVSRVHMALSADGVVFVTWDVPPAERDFPHIQRTGWQPRGVHPDWRDVPFTPPVRFVRPPSDGPSLIPRGTWVLPYDHHQYMLFRQAQVTDQIVLQQIDDDPTNSALLMLLLFLTTRPIYTRS